MYILICTHPSKQRITLTNTSLLPPAFWTIKGSLSFVYLFFVYMHVLEQQFVPYTWEYLYLSRLYSFEQKQNIQIDIACVELIKAFSTVFFSTSIYSLGNNVGFSLMPKETIRCQNPRNWSPDPFIYYTVHWNVADMLRVQICHRFIQTEIKIIREICELWRYEATMENLYPSKLVGKMTLFPVKHYQLK